MPRLLHTVSEIPGLSLQHRFAPTKTTIKTYLTCSCHLGAVPANAHHLRFKYGWSQSNETPSIVFKDSSATTYSHQQTLLNLARETSPRLRTRALRLEALFDPDKRAIIISFPVFDSTEDTGQRLGSRTPTPTRLETRLHLSLNCL